MDSNIREEILEHIGYKDNVLYYKNDEEDIGSDLQQDIILFVIFKQLKDLNIILTPKQEKALEKLKQLFVKQTSLFSIFESDFYNYFMSTYHDAKKRLKKNPIDDKSRYNEASQLFVRLLSIYNLNLKKEDVEQLKKHLEGKINVDTYTSILSDTGTCNYMASVNSETAQNNCETVDNLEDLLSEYNKIANTDKVDYEMKSDRKNMVEYMKKPDQPEKTEEEKLQENSKNIFLLVDKLLNGKYIQSRSSSPETKVLIDMLTLLSLLVNQKQIKDSDYHVGKNKVVKDLFILLHNILNNISFKPLDPRTVPIAPSSPAAPAVSSEETEKLDTDKMNPLMKFLVDSHNAINNDEIEITDDGGTDVEEASETSSNLSTSSLAGLETDELSSDTDTDTSVRSMGGEPSRIKEIKGGNPVDNQNLHKIYKFFDKFYKDLEKIHDDLLKDVWDSYYNKYDEKLKNNQIVHSGSAGTEGLPYDFDEIKGSDANEISDKISKNTQDVESFLMILKEKMDYITKIETQVSSKDNEYTSNLKQLKIIIKRNYDKYKDSLYNNADELVNHLATINELLKDDKDEKIIEELTEYKQNIQQFKIVLLRDQDLSQKALNRLEKRANENIALNSNKTKAIPGGSAQKGGIKNAEYNKFNSHYFKNLKKLIDELENLTKKMKNPSSDSGNNDNKNESPSMFENIWNEYRNYLKDDKDKKNQLKADDIFYEKMSINNLDPSSVLKINFEDKVIFIVTIFMVRLIIVILIEFLIDYNIVKTLEYTLVIYVIMYIILLAILIVIINYDSYKLRILMNYLNLHINSTKIFLHITLVIIFYILIYILTTSKDALNNIGYLFDFTKVYSHIHNALDSTSENRDMTFDLSQAEKLKLQYRLDIITMIVFFFTAFIVAVI